MQNHVNRAQTFFFKGFYQSKPGKYCFLTSLKSGVFSLCNIILGHIKNRDFNLWSHKCLCYYTYWTAITKRFLISYIFLVSNFKIIWILHNKGTVCYKMLVVKYLFKCLVLFHDILDLLTTCAYTSKAIYLWKSIKTNTCVWICVCAGTHTPAH